MTITHKELLSELELISFKNHYTQRSKLEISLSFLYSQKVYGFYDQNNNLVGGFILGFNGPYRTIEKFSTERFHNKLHDRILGGKNLFEICCFWLHRGLSKDSLLNARAWLLMGRVIESQVHKDYIIYGTNNRGLALMYNYPTNSFVYHQETLNGKSNYIFISKREYFIDGAKEIIWNKGHFNVKQEISFKYDPVIDLLLEMRDSQKVLRA